MEVAGAVIGLGELAGLAWKGSVSLYKLIQSYRFHPKVVRDLMGELEALSGVLVGLTETVSAATDIDLSSLTVPLRRCSKTCKEFEEELLKCSSRSGEDRASFRDWARLRYMGDDIDDFRRMLAGYKQTINISLTDANLRKSCQTAESLESHKILLQAATDDLGAHLQRMDEKLEIIFKRTVPASDEDATELRRIKEELLSTQKWLEICAQLSDHIEQIQIVPKRDNNLPESTEPGALPERIVHDGLQMCRSNLDLTSAKLERHLKDTMDRLMTKSKATMTSGEISELLQLWDERETALQCKNIFSQAENHLNENISVIENYTKGKATQYMVSTNGKTIHGKNQALGSIAYQVGGDLNDISLQAIVSSLSSTSVHGPEKDSSPRGSAPSLDDDALKTGGISEFSDRYGRGHKLRPDSSLDAAKTSLGSVESRPSGSPKH